ncbi:MAG: HAMP domain-containing histidine kinase [Clostridia bacterium]|nr:HAMP domain-containing histidine kinase [Clostridia bacterium]
MINKLKRKFLIIGTVFMFILMSVLVLVMNVVNYHELTSAADSNLDKISEYKMPVMEERQNVELPEKRGNFLPPDMPADVRKESRFFVARVSSDGEILQSDLSRIESVDDNSVDEYISKALANSSERGFIDNFRYYKVTDGGETRIFFLHCQMELNSFKSFLWISIIVGLAGCVVVFIAFVFTAGKIVAPIAESYEKQKRFISDAGHEIKTPLTIINANVDLLESEGESEELSDIRQQTKRLTELTNKLVLLSKMEEAEHTLQKIEFPLSDIVTETANSFRALTVARNIDFKTDITTGVAIYGSPDAVNQLLSLLLENAVKYSPDGGNITLSLKIHRKSALITVTNTAREKINASDLGNIFDRFYRSDTSRNSETGGHGIGLSIAKAIVEAHGGFIEATTETGLDFRICAALPIKQ